MHEQKASKGLRNVNGETVITQGRLENLRKNRGEGARKGSKLTAYPLNFLKITWEINVLRLPKTGSRAVFNRNSHRPRHR